MHIPVLKEEVITYLRLKEGMTIADLTVGGGGHAEEILKKIGPSGRLVAVDRDREALDAAKARLTRHGRAVRFFHANYADMDSVFAKLEMRKIDGALFDLGASSLQMENRERGFSFKLNGPLDMRMDTRGGVKASDIVNGYSKRDMARIFKEYADERFALRIADRIVSQRRRRRIETTGTLADIVIEALGYRQRFGKIHPATRVFMALRIAVNKEIEGLGRALARLADFLGGGARACVISFHSAEDRLVKNKFREWAGSGAFKLITKKPVRPGAEEIKSNPRSRSAKLRVAERLI